MARDSELDLPAIKKLCEALTEEERKAYAVCLKYSLDVPAAEVVPILESLSEARRERVAAVEALEEAQELFTKYGNHHSSCILEHHAPGVRDCGCGYVAALRAILGESGRQARRVR